MSVQDALEYVERGWYVLPCREKPGSAYINDKGNTVTPLEKTPYIKEGLLSATLDKEQIKMWWSRWPNALIGVNCGMSNLFVIDVDTKRVDGIATFKNLNINDRGAFHSKTPSGGIHIVFSGKAATTTSIVSGIDTRSEGGYFIVPPSKIQLASDGGSTGEYQKLDNWDGNPIELSYDVIKKLFPVKKGSQSTPAVVGEKKKLSRESLEFLVNGAQAGNRNAELFKVLVDFVGCGYTMDESRKAVIEICNKIGLDSSEVDTVLDHAFSKERTPSIPDVIQEKLKSKAKKDIAKITDDEVSIIEEALLSCMIKDNQVISRVIDILISNDILVKQNRVIFTSILKLFDKNITVDNITLLSEVEKIDTSITLDILEKTLSYDVSIENVESYANVIKEKSSLRKIQFLMNKGAQLAISGRSVSEVLELVEKELSDIAIDSGVQTTNILTGDQVADQVIQHTKDILDGKIKMLETGFVDFDKESGGGLYPDDLLMIAATPGSGKSALSLSIAKNVGIDKHGSVAYFSLEMSHQETLSRLICQMTGIPYDKVYRGKMSEVQWVQYKTAMDNIRNADIFWDDSSGITIPELRTKIRKVVALLEAKGKLLNVVIIDQLEQITSYSDIPQHLQFNKIGYALKAMGKDFGGIPFILNHQLKVRTGEKTAKPARTRDPQMGDLNQAGEKPTSKIWAVIHKRGEDGKIIASKIVSMKSRNSPIVNFPVQFIGERFLFANATFKGVDFSKEESAYAKLIIEDDEEGYLPEEMR